MLNLKSLQNSRKQGDAGLGLAVGWFCAAGYTVAIPLTDSQPFDLVIEDLGGKLRRVQVKTATQQRSGSFVVELRTKGGNKSGTGKTRFIDKTRIDDLFIVTDCGAFYLIPSENLDATSVLRLGPKYSQFMVNQPHVVS